MGSADKTQSGRSCLPWTDISFAMYGPGKPFIFPDNSFEDAGRFCRNPNGRMQGPWCYVTLDGDWEYCDVDHCGK